jgi:D-tyrosyl-tRNA(Tyr) deacylase
VVQRVGSARVRVEGEIVGSIELGLVILLGIARGDSEQQADELALRVANFRCFADAEGRMNLDLAQARGAALVVSQFTLVADVRSGRRPSFDPAEAPARAEQLCARFASRLRQQGLAVECGRFGAHMQLELVNDGPVTFVFES